MNPRGCHPGTESPDALRHAPFGICEEGASFSPPLTECLGMRTESCEPYQVNTAEIMQAAASDSRLQDVLGSLRSSSHDRDPGGSHEDEIHFMPSPAPREVSLVWNPKSHIQHILTCAGSCFAQHYQLEWKTLYRHYMGVYSSNRPLTAAFALNWGLLVSLFLGVLLFAGDDTARESFASLRQVAAVQARVFRFRALKLRNGQQPGMAKLGLGSLALQYHACPLQEQEHTIHHNESSYTLFFPKPVTFDGWYLITAQASHELDPVEYIVEYSSDGQEWIPAGTSSRRDRCGYGADGNLHEPQLNMPVERGKTVAFDFGSVACLWPMYLLSTAQKLVGASLTIAPFVSLSSSVRLPVLVIAGVAIFAGSLRMIALISLWFDGRGHMLPYGFVGYTPLTALLESLMVTFPDPLECPT
jgi:hypothetical protein